MVNTILKKIQSSGGRVTKVKKAIIEVFAEHHCLLSKQDLVNKLRDKKFKPDRSTIYRELKFLCEHNIIIKNTIMDVDYYEILQDKHQHLVCLSCNSFSKIKIDYDLIKQGEKIAKQNNFNITNYSIDFYGYCSKCE